MTEELFCRISGILQSSNYIYFRCEPDILDFTKPYTGQFYILTPQTSISFSIADLRQNTLVKLLFEGLFQSKNKIFTWNIKDIISYLKHRHDIPFEFSTKIIDIKYCLSFHGFKINTPPKTFKEAFDLISKFLNDDNWAKINQHVYRPLATSTLPGIENKKILNTVKNKCFYSYYEIEGQANGRLRSYKPSDSFIPIHSLSDEQKCCLLPYTENRDEERALVVLDYKHMEVSVLQWLSNDVELKRSLENGDSFYESIVTFDCSLQDKRKIGKSIFLPTIYGQKVQSLAKNLNIPFEVADSCVSQLRSRFKVAFDWIETRQNIELVDGFATDSFGRKRNFSNETHYEYKRRNFEIQGPASLICLERLNALYKVVPNNVVFHIHDGYVLSCKPHDCVGLIKKSADILKEQSLIADGLFLNVSCKAGRLFGKLAPFHIY